MLILVFCLHRLWVCFTSSCFQFFDSCAIGCSCISSVWPSFSQMSAWNFSGWRNSLNFKDVFKGIHSRVLTKIQNKYTESKQTIFTRQRHRDNVWSYPGGHTKSLLSNCKVFIRRKEVVQKNKWARAKEQLFNSFNSSNLALPHSLILQWSHHYNICVASQIWCKSTITELEMKAISPYSQ